MFNRFKKGDLVAYAEFPGSTPLGYVEKIEERKGRAVVTVRVLDSISEDEFLSLKCVKYHELEHVSPQREKEKCLNKKT